MHLPLSSSSVPFQIAAHGHQGGDAIAQTIRIQGTVQGVGFRPTIYRLAKAYRLRGEVRNDGEGVQIIAVAPMAAIDQFIQQLQAECPPLAQIDGIHREPCLEIPPFSDFTIVQSGGGAVHTLMPPDAATCPACLADILNPFSRYYRYPFTNCTHCGPRLSIIRHLPYDRAQTSMADFPLCPACQKEYKAVENRRFHAQPIACVACGPRAWLVPMTAATAAHSPAGLDDVDAVCTLLMQGEIVAIKGLGGFHLACDATNEAAVHRLRQRKHRYHKPFALMARDLKLIEQYCYLSPEESALLHSPAAPIVLLESKHHWTLAQKQAIAINSDPHADHPAAAAPPLPLIAPSVAPAQHTLGFMLPYTPLHHLILQRLDRPVVMTSGNRSDEPQCIDNTDAQERLQGIADFMLLHNRDIVNRVDDSVVRVVNGEVQVLRRARGYAPKPLPLPEGFHQTPNILAMGSELKNTFCLVRDGQAILSQHLGDLEDAKTYSTYEQALELYQQVFEHQPAVIAVDQHPDYLSTKLGLTLATQNLEGYALKLQVIQHHHAHVAACMAENGLPLKHPPILGIALDGLGAGDDGTFWGGEFLLADYHGYRRLGCFKPIAMLGGEQAIRQPWRNTYAHLRAAFEWDELMSACQDLELIQFLSSKPQAFLEQMLEKEMHSPLASSAGRLFDAVAAAVGICCEEATYEGQGAVELEALIRPEHLTQPVAYPFEIMPANSRGVLVLEPRSMWLALLSDLVQGLDRGLISARFHLGLADAIAGLTDELHQVHPFTQVALTGGVFQNKILALEVQKRLEALGLKVLLHQKVPPNDGGLSLGQAVIAAARQLATTPMIS